MNLDAYTSVVTDLTTALGASVVDILPAVAVSAGGLIAFSLGLRVVRRVAK